MRFPPQKNQAADPAPVPARILVVDDSQPNLIWARDFIRMLGHTPVLAENGEVALDLVKQDPPDLILLDITMPVMDGYEVLERLKGDAGLRHLPVIMTTAVDDMQSISRCIEMGADDYLTKPVNLVLLNARISAGLEKKRLRDQEEKYRRQIEDYNQNLEKRVQEQVLQITSAQRATIFAMARLAESRDPETGAHLERMREYCRILCEHFGRSGSYGSLIDDAYIEDIYAACPLHDIGKVGIPDRILQKPGPLTEAEFEVMKTHTRIGSGTLRAVADEYPGNAFIGIGIAIAESHHERWDGSGYPAGLEGEAIPLAARILALGDVYDALTSRRCYKEAYSHEKSREIILAGSGAHFDPNVVTAFLSVEQAFVAVRERYDEDGQGL